MNNKNKHLTLDERRIILKGIENESTKVAIASTLGKHKSTIGKEIALHRFLKHKASLPSPCSNYKHCLHNWVCKKDCIDFYPFTCKRRDCSPGACNGCKKINGCRFDKFYYSPETAEKEYKETLIDSRLGVNLTTKEAKELGNFIKPLIQQGQSPYTISINHPELGLCEKTVYNYIDSGVFECVGIHNIDLRRKTSRKMSKKQSAHYKKREDRKYLQGRTYKDYLEYNKLNPNGSVVEMDTVYNDVSNGPFIQTFKFLDYGLLLGIYHTVRNSQTMVQGVDLLQEVLGNALFYQCVEVLLTDRGSEFHDAQGFEMVDEIRRTRIFYCDPMQSGQKGSLENNHRELRYILPKETNLTTVGLTSQSALNICLSHINSSPKEKLKDKSAIEMTKFLNEELMNKLHEFGIKEIEKDRVILKPYLLKQ